uniref:Telomere-binding protein 1 n=1 Tax=Cajanus cajan TaxID=3821 RepID=A0A151TIW1_CAJCA|nr:Telomere-binding protein 1 [Cajanus cajan]
MNREEYLRKCSNMKCQRVDESYVPALQDEVMEVEHLLAEPRNDHASLDGCLDSHTTLNDKDDLELEVLDGLLDDVEIDDLEGTDGFSGACEEYLLDFEFAGKFEEVLGSDPFEGSLLQNSSSESHSSGLSGSSIVGGVLESTKVPIAQSECKNDSLDETVTYESHGTFRNNPSQPSKVNCRYNISLDIQHLQGLDNDCQVASGLLTCKKEKGLVEKCQPAALREKRFRKPTQRYIEEFSDSRSKEKVPTADTKAKHSSDSSCNVFHIRIKALKESPSEKSSNENSDLILPELQVSKGRLKKEELEYDEESFPSESEDGCSTTKRSRRNDRRKHQKMWTLPEVMKLVEGISEYGVGRWTDIKRFLFSSSSYRTPIDLRDKWRNLLRASSAQKNKTEAEQNDELALRPLPFNVVHRVRELAKIHPYPRQRGSKKSRVSQAGSFVIAKDSPSKRSVRRKKCT